MQTDFSTLKLIKNHPFSNTTALQFSLDGRLALSSTSQKGSETISIYNTQTGSHMKMVYSKKYGLGDISCVRFAQSSSTTTGTILHSSSKEDDIIRYLSLHDNSYIRYFKGHKSKVVSMDTSKINDQFLSGSYDDVRLWDLRSPMCAGVLHFEGRSHPVVAIDPEGVVFGVGINSCVRLYDMRNFDKGPFNMAPGVQQQSYIQNHSDEVWNKMEFSNNVCDLAITTSHGRIHILDSVQCVYKAILRTQNVGLCEASFTPDGNHLVVPEKDSVRILDVNDPTRIIDLPAPGVKFAKMNPKYAMMATSTSEQVNFWLPYFAPLK